MNETYQKHVYACCFVQMVSGNVAAASAAAVGIVPRAWRTVRGRSLRGLLNNASDVF